MPESVEYAGAPPEVRAVFDDIRATRGVPDVNNFWKALAVHPPTLARTWEGLKAVMAPLGIGLRRSRPSGRIASRWPWTR